MIKTVIKIVKTTVMVSAIMTVIMKVAITVIMLVIMTLMMTVIMTCDEERRMQPARGRFARFDLDRQIASTFPAHWKETS